MRRSAFANPGTIPGTFTYDETKPTYWTEWLSWWLIRMVDVMVVQGFEFAQEEEDEYDALNTALTTWYASLATWWDDAVDARDAEESIPAIPTLPTLPVEGGVPGIIGGLLQVAKIVTLLAKLRKDLDSTTDSGEVAEILKKAFLQPNNSDSIIHKAFVLSSPASIGVSANAIKNLLGTLNEEIELIRNQGETEPDSGIGVLKKALLNSSDDSLIDALAAIGLRIKIDPQGAFVEYGDE